jgi:hypothetical protein
MLLCNINHKLCGRLSVFRLMDVNTVRFNLPGELIAVLDQIIQNRGTNLMGALAQFFTVRQRCKCLQPGKRALLGVAIKRSLQIGIRNCFPNEVWK